VFWMTVILHAENPPPPPALGSKVVLTPAQETFSLRALASPPPPPPHNRTLILEIPYGMYVEKDPNALKRIVEPQVLDPGMDDVA
jgi:hypothetical protein